MHYQRIHKKWWISPAFLVIIRVVSRMSANWMKNLSNRFCAVTMFLIILRQGVDILGCPISSPIQIPIGKHLHSLRKPTGQQRGTTRTAKGELAIRLVHLCNSSKKLYTQCRKMLPISKGLLAIYQALRHKLFEFWRQISALILHYCGLMCSARGRADADECDW